MSNKIGKSSCYYACCMIILFIFIGLSFLVYLNIINSGPKINNSNMDNVETIKEPINKDRTKYLKTLSEKDEGFHDLIEFPK